MRRAIERISGRGDAEAAAPLAQDLYREVYDAPLAGVATASAFVPLLAEHTHYFGGFGLLARTAGGVAVAVGPSSSGTRVIASGGNEEALRDMVSELGRRIGGGSDPGLDVAIVCGAASSDAHGLLAAGGVSFMQAAGFEGGAGRVARLVAEVVETVLQRPFGPAYALASLDGWPFVLVDAGTHEHVGIARPDSLGVGTIEVGVGRPPTSEAFQARTRMVTSSIERLQSRGYADLTSLRDLEHQELPRALAIVEASARPFLRHLVTEDRRVPRMVTALRREDPQVLGALMLMSHASRRDDDDASIEEVEFIVDMAEAADGIYGARMAGPGYGGAVVIVGRPFLLPDVADQIVEAYGRRYGAEPVASLL